MSAFNHELDEIEQYFSTKEFADKVINFVCSDLLERKTDAAEELARVLKEGGFSLTDDLYNGALCDALIDTRREEAA